ncbi:MAG: DUF599 domain-containing protein [Rhodobacter sp.]|jgi:uncharacterized membrane protein|nr:DUF599 domain-containing protein [Rhodobacter sp.]MCA3491944.1 DUF599 domain-containing protein [Rhodobacter sp.]MCA3500935.1 DUF599 domain-containing protein [Rhodobacter sp.]MCA3501915.1 DUF599 domain-containing protein [Rhodobacter sp.]MCE2738808.1 DUF599 domain-containing protein [Rhodobacter sp.]
MTWHFHGIPFGALDLLALAVLAVSWIAIGWGIEHPPKTLPSVTTLMVDFRRDWMRQFVTRQPRIFDATMIDSLRQGTAFFASACLIAIGGGVALMGNPAGLMNLTQDFAPAGSSEGIELRIIPLLLLLADALMKFIWSHRLFGYCAILMAAVPNDPADPLAYHRAAQAAEINITAARSFNRGLRSVYFALAALAWLFGAVALLATTVLCLAVLIRREFASQSRAVLLRRP